MQTKKEKVVRFAPSPTGLLHIGSVRTALFNYLFAKKEGARFILRFEDTDKERSKKEFEENILEGLSWLDLSYDEIYKQSERTDIYKAHLERLIQSGNAYVSAEEEGDRSSVIRFKNPNHSITFMDSIRGEVTFDTTELGDFVIAKSMTEPLYNFAVVVDDLDMGVTDIIRGEDHISNTPRQILIIEALGGDRPNYAHIPMILAPDRSKMSKRHGAVSVTEYREQGFLPEALINYLAFLGWNPGGDQEVFSREELIDKFSLERVHRSGAIFSIEKLRWFNAEHLKLLPQTEKEEKIYSYLKEKNVSENYLSLYKANEAFRSALSERAETLGDIYNEILSREYEYLLEPPSTEKDQLLWKDSLPETTKEHLEKVRDLLSSVEDFSDPKNIKTAIWDYATEKGRGEVLWPTRMALSGKERSLDPFTISAIVGKIETIKRIESAIKEF